jgi:hypothetical protein
MDFRSLSLYDLGVGVDVEGVSSEVVCVYNVQCGVFGLGFA